MTLRKGIQMGQALMNIGSDVAGTIEKSNRAEEDKLTQEYLQMIQSGQNPEEVEQMEEPGVIGKTFGAKAKPRKINQKALMNAYFQDYKMKMQDTNYRKAKLELATNESRHAKQAAVDAFAQYNGALKGGDMKSADQIAVQIYNNYPNGETLEVDQDTGKIYQMKEDKDGQLVRGEETKLPTRDKIAELMKGIMEGRKFEESFVGQLQSNEIANWKAKMEAEKVVDNDGNFVGYMAKVIDPKTGKPDWQFSSNTSSGTQPWLEARKSGLQLESSYLGTKGKKAEISSKQALTADRKASAKQRGVASKAETRKGWSSDRKLAADLAETVEAFRGDTDKAMRYVQKIRTAKDFRAAYKIAMDELLMTDNQEIKDFIDSIMTSLPENPRAKQTGKGLPGAAQDNEAKRLKAKPKEAEGIRKGDDGKHYATTADGKRHVAQKGKDGEWYVKKADGWYIYE
jgi:hypothetical protein